MQSVKGAVRAARRVDGALYATYFALILAFVPVVEGAVRGFHEKRPYAGPTWLVFGLLLLLAMVLLFPKAEPDPPAPTTIFQPLVDINELKAWPRRQETTLLLKRLKAAKDGKPVVVVGVSGAGKTVLLRRLLPERLATSKIDSTYVDAYPSLFSFRTVLREYLEGIQDAAPAVRGSDTVRAVVILDQFEQYLAGLKELSETDQGVEKDALRALLTDAELRRGVAVLISLRWEWYYELRWLEDLIPSPSDCVEITGPTTESGSDPTRTDIAARFDELFSDEAKANRIVEQLSRKGRVLPLEAQIVGAALERLAGPNVGKESVSLATVGGVARGIDSFFEAILAGAPDRRIALKVCCALSVHSRFRRQEDLNTIVEAVFESAKDVEKAVEYLKDQHVVIKRGRLYELAHDYLADFFQQKSGAELDPPERDNTIFHMEAKTNRSLLVPLVAERDKRGRGDFALWVIVPVCVLITCRLLVATDKWTWAGYVPAKPVVGHALDLSYVPIFVAHFAWAIYVASLYRGLLAKLDLGGWGLFFSRLTVLNMAACVVVAVFIPYAWLASIGWGGLFLGLRLWSLSARPELNMAAKSRIRGFAMVTSANLLFLGGLGGIGLAIAFHYVHDPKAFDWWLLASAYAGIVLTYSAYALGPVHLQPKAVSQMLGLLARPHETVVSRPEV